MLLNGFFITSPYNPDLPPEEWTLVYEKRTPGNFSYAADWGKYKIEVSGGGGAGSVVSTVGSYVEAESNNGTNGEKTNIDRILYRNVTEVFSGIIGAGGAASKTDGVSPYFHPGTPGAGYQNGTSGDGTAYGNNTNGAKVCGGSGGGASCLYINNNLVFTCKGGNGGKCEAWGSGIRLYGPSGTGGGGGISGTGSSGGLSVSTRSTSANGNPGVDGYILIYKSNLKPELV